MTTAVFIGTRADLGPLESIIRNLAEHEGNVYVFCGVTFDSEELRESLTLAGIVGPEVRALAPPLASVTALTMARQSAELLHGASRELVRLGVDVLVVLGDRWELLSVVTAAYLLGVRIVHIHGGEVTAGAIDDRVRHAVSKLADMHCVASKDAAERLRQLGEPDERILVTGAPGLDRIVRAVPMGKDELSTLLGRAPKHPIALFTYHPPTAEAHLDLKRAVTVALRETVDICPTVIVTDPGPDPGRDEIIAALAACAAEDPRIVRVSSLGTRYPAVLRAVDVVVGNSSSGIIEAATAGIPAVDIGTRQEGRLRADSVVHADGSVGDTHRAIGQALLPAARALAIPALNPYGAGESAPRISDAIERARNLPTRKQFIDK